MLIAKEAEPYLLSGGAQGVLLIHGFTGSPAEMRTMADYLHERGFTVLAVRLPGHGTSVEDLNTMVWQQWYRSAVDAYSLLKDMCAEVFVVGLSMGSLLALRLAAKFPLAKVVVLSTPINIYDKRLPLLPVYRLFKHYVPKKRRGHEFEGIYTYDSYPLAALSSFLELINDLKGRLSKVRQPVLIIQSRVEKTVRPDSANYIYDNVASSVKELFWLENSGHMVVLGVERELVFEKVYNFLKEQ